MLSKRLIACLDIAGERVVKGTNFVNLRDGGDPVAQARRYSDEGADEIVLLDINASQEVRPTTIDLVERVARSVFVPLTVGGGVRTVQDARRLLHAGADKVSVNSAAIGRPELISELATEFGSQATVLAIDAKRCASGWAVYRNGGREATDLEAVAWAGRGQSAGAGEILLTSIDADGVQRGFDLDLVGAVCAVVHVPVVASGGAGSSHHFADLFTRTPASAGLAASILHDGTTTLGEIKGFLAAQGLMVRPL